MGLQWGYSGATLLTTGNPGMQASRLLLAGLLGYSGATWGYTADDGKSWNADLITTREVRTP